MNQPQARFESRDGGVLAIFGALTFATVALALREGEDHIATARPNALDLAGVEHADSAGLACVLALLASGRRIQPSLKIRNAPESLQALARVSDAEHWLG